MKTCTPGVAHPLALPLGLNLHDVSYDATGKVFPVHCFGNGSPYRKASNQEVPIILSQFVYMFISKS